jgi:hypothetical protein
MRFRGTLLLLVIAVALTAYYVLVERPRQEAERAARDARLVALRPESIDRLTIARPDTTIELRVVDTHWEMVEPVADLADDSAVMRLLAAIDRATVERNIGPQDEATPFGLDDPITIEAWTRGDPALALDVGGYTVDRGFVYATRAGDDDVLLVPTAIRRYAAAAVEDFRFKRVATFDLSLVDSFVVTSPERTVRWGRDGLGWSTVAGTDTIRGNPAAVEGILRRLRAWRVSGFPSPGRGHSGDVSHLITVYRSGPSPWQAFAVAPQPTSCIVTVQPGDRVVAVDSVVMEVFDITVDEVREKRLLRFDPTRAARVELTTSDTLATLVRAGASWTSPNPALGNLDGRRVDAALAAARALEFDRVRSERVPAGGFNGRVTFRLAVFDDGGTIVDELLCVVEPGDPVAVATSASSRLVAEVAVEKLRRLESQFRRIRDR